MLLKVSVLLNVMLLGGAVLLWIHDRPVTVPAPAAPTMAAKVDPQTAPAPIVETVAAPFRWNQLMCTNDYRAYVANLRAAGCPEATVADIVRGNAGRAYAMMRQKLGVNETQPGPWSAQAQAQMVAYFLGQSPTAMEAQGVAKALAAPAAVGQNSQMEDNGKTGTATLAAFLQNVDLTTPGMTAEQAQQTTNLRQAYLAQISASAVSQAQNNQASSSTSSSANTASSQGGTENSATSPDNSLTGADSSQNGADNSQTGQGRTRDPRLQWTPAQQALILAAQQESILEGLFGSGAAAQYEQYQSSQGGQQ